MSSPLALLELATHTFPNAAVSLTQDGNGNPVYTFEPPLTAPEQATLADLQLMANFGIPATITLAEFQALKPSLAIGRQIVAAPVGTVLTAAQNLASHQALWKVIGALLRS